MKIKHEKPAIRLVQSRTYREDTGVYQYDKESLGTSGHRETEGFFLSSIDQRQGFEPKITTITAKIILEAITGWMERRQVGGT